MGISPLATTDIDNCDHPGCQGFIWCRRAVWRATGQFASIRRRASYLWALRPTGGCVSLDQQHCERGQHHPMGFTGVL